MFFESLIIKSFDIQLTPPWQGRLRSMNGCDSDIMWSGNAWTCGKQLKHYRAFCRNGTTIAVSICKPYKREYRGIFKLTVHKVNVLSLLPYNPSSIQNLMCYILCKT